MTLGTPAIRASESYLLSSMQVSHYTSQYYLGWDVGVMAFKDFEIGGMDLLPCHPKPRQIHYDQNRKLKIT